jgi:hypothetical protein
MKFFRAYGDLAVFRAALSRLILHFKDKFVSAMAQVSKKDAHGVVMQGVVPDVACYAKLLTGGTLPLAATIATEEVFEAFRGAAKTDALLHGISKACPT